MQLAIFASILATATMAVGQDEPDYTGVPECARPCFASNFKISGCASQTDTKCLCASPDYNAAVTECVLKACSKEDVTTTILWANERCSENDQ